MNGIEKYKANVKSKLEQRRKELVEGETDAFLRTLIGCLFDECISMLIEEQTDERH